MSNSNSAADHLRPLALDFAKHRTIKENDLHTNRHWKKIKRLPVGQRYEILLLALKGFIQERDPGFENGLWFMIVENDLDLMLHKADTLFLWNVADLMGSVTPFERLPKDFCWSVLEALQKAGMISPLNHLIERLEQHLSDTPAPSKKAVEWIAKVEHHFPKEAREGNKFGRYFVNSFEEEQAWYDLDINTKNFIKQYETDLFYDRGPKPSDQRKQAVIQAVATSKIKNKLKKALIESIEKKG